MKPLLRGLILTAACVLTFSAALAQDDHVHDNTPRELEAVADVNHEDVLRITGNLVCNCGCPPTLVRACSCHRAEEITREVQGLLAAGKTDEEVYQRYVSEFGAQMLAAPKPEGFNLLGWVLPFVALALFGGGMAMVYKKLRVQESAVSAAAPVQSQDDQNKYRKMLERELSED